MAQLKVNSSRLNELLEFDNRENRHKMKNVLFNDRLYAPRFEVSLKHGIKAHSISFRPSSLLNLWNLDRELALERLSRIAKGGYISVFDFERNPLNVFAVHEVAGMVDGSMATKLTYVLTISIFFSYINE
jgi:acyl-CoA oxidase